MEILLEAKKKKELLKRSEDSKMSDRIGRYKHFAVSFSFKETSDIQCIYFLTSPSELVVWSFFAKGFLIFILVMGEGPKVLTPLDQHASQQTSIFLKGEQWLPKHVLQCRFPVMSQGL